MRFIFLGKTYNLQLWHRLLPIGLQSVVQRLEGYPADYYEHTDGHSLEGKVALVTGGYRGIGLCIAKSLLQQGAKVIITGRNRQQLRQCCERVNINRLQYIVWDISSLSSFLENFERAEQLFSQPVNILINNAGVNKWTSGYVSFEDITFDQLREMHNINLMGTVAMCREFSNRYNDGIIINMLSNRSFAWGAGAYSMSKRALYSFTKTFGEECISIGKNIRVNGICPGPTKTTMICDENSQVKFGGTLNRRLGLPEEIAAIVVNMIQGAFLGMNGTVIVADGGEQLR